MQSLLQGVWHCLGHCNLCSQEHLPVFLWSPRLLYFLILFYYFSTSRFQYPHIMAIVSSLSLQDRNYTLALFPEFLQTPGHSEGRGSLACCSSWGLRVGHSVATEQQRVQYPHLRAIFSSLSLQYWNHTSVLLLEFVLKPFRVPVSCF